MVYKFPDWNVEIQNPQVETTNVGDGYKGSAFVSIKLSLGAPSANAASFGFTFPDAYTYVGDQAMKADVEAWIQTELLNYEV